MADSPRLQQLQSLLANEPGDPFLQYALAMEQMSLGDAAAAVATFTSLAQGQPDYVPTYLMLAQALQKLGRDTDAAEVLRNGIRAAEKAGELHALGELQGMLAIVE
ncbi:MAG: tetratricopeptide repeat protein [Gemmataceae bacterium]